MAGLRRVMLSPMALLAADDVVNVTLLIIAVIIIAVAALAYFGRRR